MLGSYYRVPGGQKCGATHTDFLLTPALGATRLGECNVRVPRGPPKAPVEAVREMPDFCPKVRTDFGRNCADYQQPPALRADFARIFEQPLPSIGKNPTVICCFARPSCRQRAFFGTISRSQRHCCSSAASVAFLQNWHLDLPRLCADCEQPSGSRALRARTVRTTTSPSRAHFARMINSIGSQNAIVFARMMASLYGRFRGSSALLQVSRDARRSPLRTLSSSVPFKTDYGRQHSEM